MHSSFYCEYCNRSKSVFRFWVIQVFTHAIVYHPPIPGISAAQTSAITEKGLQYSSGKNPGLSLHFLDTEQPVIYGMALQRLSMSVVEFGCIKEEQMS